MIVCSTDSFESARLALISFSERQPVSIRLSRFRTAHYARSAARLENCAQRGSLYPTKYAGKEAGEN
jgi:hypothetical protein